MQALGDAASLLAGRSYSQAGRLSQCWFRFRFCLAVAVAAAAERVNTAVELAKSSDCSLIHSLVVDSVDCLFGVYCGDHSVAR